ncbi:hypothetical protein THRCLA_04693 [Thraustotheca clavata]|uniref:Transmembrane protein n=1 Tax=Thraustotheca clavata TaxID=74557 RepID=A0A1V9ZYA4_9STRA|nr:hypothetical protein THRCLA_04693 [Thraustotheca clavata]
MVSRASSSLMRNTHNINKSCKAKTLYITTCVIGGTADVGWGDIQFIAGYSSFPECLPTSGAQPVAGMMMLETTIRAAHPEGVYLMTLYSDLTSSMQHVHNYVNTDGSVSRLLENVKRTIITQTGVIENDELGSDYIITSRRLGERYLVTESCHTEIEEILLFLTGMNLQGWSQGLNSGIPIVPGWNCGHSVSKSIELIAFQVIFAVLTLVLLSGDLLATYQAWETISASSQRFKSDKATQEEKTSYVAITRIFSNLVAGALVFLSVVTLLVLLSQNMFARSIVSVNVQTTDYFWEPYGQNCKLQATGFVPNTCSADEMAAITPQAWTAVGVALAQQWSLELKQAFTLYVTTCIVGGISAVGWANLQFIAGFYNGFPDCLPSTGAQPVAGMMMLETTIRSSHPEGVYMMTLYSDLTPVMQNVEKHVNTDGSVSRLIQNAKRTVITQAGGIEDDILGSDYIITSQPLGRRYLVTESCHTEIEELTTIIQVKNLPGWSQGKNSGLPIAPGWNCGHVVDNSSELIAIQVILACLKGVLAAKPVLTYAILSGLERRKLLLLCIVLNALPGLLYLDVSRIYFFTDNGFKIWSLSTVMVASFFSFGWLFIVSIVDMLVIPLRPLLRLFLNNQTWPSGAYVATSTASTLTLLSDEIISPLFVAWGISMMYTTLYRKFVYNRLFLSTEWCSTNSFLSHITPPNFLTTLPLEQSNAIRIGNRMFCKPSTMALLGYASVLEVEHDRVVDSKIGEDFSIVSIYNLVPALYCPRFCYTPRVVGIFDMQALF